MKKFILALAQGTTSSRAILFDHQGQMCGSAALEFPQHFPHPGWVEHDPNEIWNSQLTVARKVLHDNHVDAAHVLAIGIANRCHGCLAFHAKALVELGCCRAEFMEMLQVAIYIGGGPSLMTAAEALQAYEQFGGEAAPN
jgi:AhpD family alkylhydroperoxidase